MTEGCRQRRPRRARSRSAASPRLSKLSRTASRISPLKSVAVRDGRHRRRRPALHVAAHCAVLVVDPAARARVVEHRGEAVLHSGVATGPASPRASVLLDDGVVAEADTPPAASASGPGSASLLSTTVKLVRSSEIDEARGMRPRCSAPRAPAHRFDSVVSHCPRFTTPSVRAANVCASNESTDQDAGAPCEARNLRYSQQMAQAPETERASEAERQQSLQSLERGMAVIQVFSRERPALTLSEVANLTGITRATARRILLTLEKLGHVRSDGRLFSPTPRLLTLGWAYLSSLNLSSWPCRSWRRSSRRPTSRARRPRSTCPTSSTWRASRRGGSCRSP